MQSKNSSKIIAFVSLAVIVFAIGYYFFVFAPKTRNAEMLSKNQLTCSQLEGKVKANYDKEYELGIASNVISYLNSSNHFNEKLQKCIVDISYDWNSYNADLAYSEEYIVDAVENKKLMRCSER